MKGTTPSAPVDRRELIASLWQDAEREAEATLSQARTEAVRTVDEARRLADGQVEQALTEVRGLAEPEAARILNHALGESRRRLLEARHAFLDRCLSTVAAHLDGPSRPTEDFPRLLAEALAGLPPGAAAKVQVEPRRVGEARAAAESLGLVAEVTGDPSLRGGARVVADGGREVRDNTLTSRLETLRGDPPLELLALLAPPPSAGGRE